LADRILAQIKMSAAKRQEIGALNRTRIVQIYPRQKMADAFRLEFNG
jgi:Skp family chaperone for outer membrane proteins